MMLPSKMGSKKNHKPSEKTTETLFVAHAFHYVKTHYPHLDISVFAPSQQDEVELGYDARFVEANSAFEVVLQFKSATPTTHFLEIRPDRTSPKHAKTQNSQHEILMAYPNRTAFYVAPTFKTYEDVSKKQTINSDEFLNHYVAVNAKSLLPGTTRIRYEAEYTGQPKDVRHLEKAQRENNALTLSHPRNWLMGSELFQFFITLIDDVKKTGVDTDDGEVVGDSAERTQYDPKNLAHRGSKGYNAGSIFRQK